MRDNESNLDEQLAALESEEKKTPTKEFETVSERVEKKEDTSPFDEDKDADKKLNLGVLIAILAVPAIALAIMLCLYFMGQPTDSTEGDTSLDTSTLEGITGDEDSSGVVVAENRLDVPENVETIEEALVYFSLINSTVVTYMEEMKEVVIYYNNRETTDIYVEDLMASYKSSILLDIEILAKYKSIYEQFGAENLYLVTVDRYQNAYALAQSSKNVMTESAIITNTNLYIGNEEEYNTRAITSLLEILDTYDINYTYTNNVITF